MPLSKLEREVITDSMLKVQSIQASLEQIDDSKIPESEEIHDCLENADQSFRDALKDTTFPEKPAKKKPTADRE